MLYIYKMLHIGGFYMFLQNLYYILSKCNKKSVSVEIKGSISIPYFIQRFEFIECDDFIYFGEEDSETFPFRIYKETISNIEFLDEYYAHVKFTIENDGFITMIVILCEEANLEFI